jgi:hypothetical protein
MCSKFFLIVLSYSLNATAANPVYKREPESCFPMTSQKFQTGLKSFGQGLTQEEFDQLIDTAQSIMGPEVQKQIGEKLIFDKRWADATVDAFATRDDQNNAVVVMNGGLARHPQMTRDAFLLLICHEIGHHLGGAPKVLRGNSGLRGWSSAEGQADYYATSKCLPLFFKAGIDIKSFDADMDPSAYKTALSKCRDNACAKITLAGLATSKVFASLVAGTPEPKITANDSTKVPKTIYNHPNPQCRLDTFMSGANCDLGPDVPFDTVDAKVGACVKDTGARPACWFQEKAY